jgi:hypothetical protein
MEVAPRLDQFLAPAREGQLAARVIAEVIRQDYRPALRMAGYIRWMAQGRSRGWEAWQMTRDGFTKSMFHRSFLALGDQAGLEEANAQIRAFAKDFIASFDKGMDELVAGTLRPVPLDDRDKSRMRDWLVLLEESERALNSVLVTVFGPQKRRRFQSPLKL